MDLAHAQWYASQLFGKLHENKKRTELGEPQNDVAPQFP